MNIDYIRVDSELYKVLIDQSHLKRNEIYISLIVLNKIIYNYYYNLKTGFKTKKGVRGKENPEDTFVSKSILSINNWFGKREITDRCLKEWVNLGLVERGNSYRKGEYSKGFLPKLLPTNKFVTLKAVDYLSDRQILNLKKRVEKMRDKDIEWHLINLKNSIEIDILKLTIFINIFYNVNISCDTKEELIQQVMDLEIKKEDIKKVHPNYTEKQLEEEFRRKTFYRAKILDLLDIEHSDISKGSKSGRHYHLLSNTPRELKHCIVSKDPNKPYLMQVDIKNSQPFFLLCLINRRKLEIEESIKMFIVGGKFYELIGDILGYNSGEVTGNPEIRKKVKELVYRDIFFCETNTIRQNNKNFKKIMERYPLFCQAVVKVSNQKAKDGTIKTLAQCLQEMETKQMLPLVKKFKGIGIHDAVLSIAVNKVDTIEEIKKELIDKFTKKFNLVPQVSVEMISERREGLNGILDGIV